MNEKRLDNECNVMDTEDRELKRALEIIEKNSFTETFKRALENPELRAMFDVRSKSEINALVKRTREKIDEENKKRYSSLTLDQLIKEHLEEFFPREVNDLALLKDADGIPQIVKSVAKRIQRRYEEFKVYEFIRTIIGVEKGEKKNYKIYFHSDVQLLSLLYDLNNSEIKKISDKEKYVIGNKLVLFLKELHDDFQNDIGETKLDQLYDLAYGNVWKHLNIKPPKYEIESIRERHIKLSDDDIKKLKHRKKKNDYRTEFLEFCESTFKLSDQLRGEQRRLANEYAEKMEKCGNHLKSLKTFSDNYKKEYKKNTGRSFSKPVCEHITNAKDDSYAKEAVLSFWYFRECERVMKYSENMIPEDLKIRREQYEAEVINEVRMKFGKPMDNVDVRFELQYIKNLKAHLSKT